MVCHRILYNLVSASVMSRTSVTLVQAEIGYFCDLTVSSSFHFIFYSSLKQRLINAEKLHIFVLPTKFRSKKDQTLNNPDSVFVSDEAGVAGPPPSAGPCPPHHHDIVSSLLHVRHRHHPHRNGSCNLPLHQHPGLPQTEEAMEEPKEVKERKGCSASLHPSPPRSPGFIWGSTERWRTRR